MVVHIFLVDILNELAVRRIVQGRLEFPRNAGLLSTAIYNKDILCLIVKKVSRFVHWDNFLWEWGVAVILGQNFLTEGIGSILLENHLEANISLLSDYMK
jgi:hypothetical protein